MDGGLFQRFCELAYGQAGISIRAGKETLVAARIQRRQRALGIASAAEYLDHLEADDSGDELVQFLDAITTNFTSFWREPDHFDFLAAELGRWRREGRRKLRIWSAASSSGEEPYSIAICVREALGDADVDVKILATDLSTRMLRAAERGLYPKDRLRALPPGLAARHFRPAAEPGCVEVDPELRALVTFKRLNLSRERLPMQGPFDVIFCRNVMIYFDREVRQRLVSECERLLHPDGWFLAGHSEPLIGLDTALQPLRPSIYRSTRSAEARP